MVALSGRAIAGVGTAEAHWRAGGCLDGLPRVGLSHLLDGRSRLVVAAPHPDDEVLGCGGLIAMAVTAGVEVLVVSITDGEACYPGNPDWSPPRLRATRREELARAMAVLGVPPAATLRLAMHDGAIAGHEAALAARLAAIAGPRDLLLVPWRRDGHPDHEAAARACIAAAAVRGAGVLQVPVWAWHWARADGSDFAGTRLQRLDLPPAVRRAKQQAIACFASQILPTAATPVPVLSPRVLRHFARTFETFIHE